MRKLIYILLIGVFIACSGEETLTPMEVKNWYVITPTENMDEVDDMIYRLYEKYDLAALLSGLVTSTLLNVILVWILAISVIS